MPVYIIKVFFKNPSNGPAAPYSCQQLDAILSDQGFERTGNDQPMGLHVNSNLKQYAFSGKGFTYDMIVRMTENACNNFLKTSGRPKGYFITVTRGYRKKALRRPNDRMLYN